MAWQHQGLVSFYLNRADSDEEEAEMEAKMPPPFGLEIGLSAINKAGQSGGGGVDMLVPNAAFDAPLSIQMITGRGHGSYHTFGLVSNGAGFLD